ncbi:MAG: hypothetical protein VKO01_10780 [Cyanobacteriota bacterium]|nr:hypothetical protein [Cyanobacteriota bacterium]
MALKDRPHDPRDRDFIRWSAIGHRAAGAGRKRPDPEIAVDHRRLQRYLDSLEGFSGQ